MNNRNGFINVTSRDSKQARELIKKKNIYIYICHDISHKKTTKRKKKIGLITDHIPVIRPDFMLPS